MTMRLQELHAALVHMPITMLPVALATDAAGRISGSPSLLGAGKVAIAATAGGAAVAAIAGVLAQETTTFDAESRDLLVTHRNLNLGLIGLTGLMATRRARRATPSLGYFAAGLAGLGVMTYSAYLGGLMVYQHGVGVEGAGKLRHEDAPYLDPERADEVAVTAAGHLRRGLRDVVATLARGDLLPALTKPRARPGSGRPSASSLSADAGSLRSAGAGEATGPAETLGTRAATSPSPRG